MINLIIFDLDGVLVQAKKIHFDAFNQALGKQYEISWQHHLNRFDGLKTKQKLKMLSIQKGLPQQLHQKIWDKKQQLTMKKLQQIKVSETLKTSLENLKKNYKLACCSNSIRDTIITILTKLQIIEYFDLIISNQDVKNSKPHPQMYWKAMIKMQSVPQQTLIIQDSPHGLQAAKRSGAHIMRVKNPEQVTFRNIQAYIRYSIYKEWEKIMNSKYKWKNDKMNILIPMAGGGTRFQQAGYTFPKPLIQVNGKPMIQLVVQNLNMDANYIFIVQKKHRKKYNLDSVLNIIAPNCKIIQVNGITQGAACTALLAKQLIDNENPLFLSNCDQYVQWNSSQFMYKAQETNCDGLIATFKSIHPKWSFAKLDENGKVVEVAEKNPVSDNATVGFYYWKHGADFVKYAQKMIQKNVRVNNQFYICPVFNQAIEDDKLILIKQIERMWGIGTPQDLEYFLENYGK